MRFFQLLYAAGLFHAVRSAPRSALTSRASVATPCDNTATSRKCWGDYSVDTDYYTEVPDTGVTKEYWLSIDSMVLAPDGYETTVLVVNGSVPGPTIEANWGDNVVIHVTNNANVNPNGTTIHWHGIRQLNSNPSDGTPGVTQCPIAPGSSVTYKFRATQYGTSWYHSHYSLQLATGLAGPIVIHGPATADYDVDVGPLLVQEWFHRDVYEVWESSQRIIAIVQPAAENGLINGMNTFDCTGSSDPKCVGGGKRWETSFTPGLKYLFRVVGVQADGWMRFAIDGHKLTVIASDFVPITPYETDSIVLASGQRYDVVVEANQTVGNYWLRAIYQTACNQNDNDNKDNILGIIRYDGADTSADPTTTVKSSIPNACGDEPYASLTPWLVKDVGASSVQTEIGLQWYYELDLVFHWTLHGQTLIVNWSDPSLLDLYKNPATSFPADSNVITINGTNEWVYWIIQDLAIVDAYHPMHLHGHDFYVLAQGEGIFVPGLVSLNTKNPPRRDTVTLYGDGYTVIAFLTDNPGAWLFHCHIAWHASQGLAMQVIERPSEVAGLVSGMLDDINSNCASWDSFYSTAQNILDDSGI